MRTHFQGSQLCGRFPGKAQSQKYKSQSILQQPTTTKRSKSILSTRYGRDGHYRTSSNIDALTLQTKPTMKLPLIHPITP
ncbi:hypothetical protein H5410_050946 [Solanum commersonii]|uniref:Uncharacterized protein n=1 Tax=Solanum commersonii TaxID=4109 RepID=A0A9J5WY79_SOLCO|nr:hypothetical protein H5410_050946 [Solanum commersonii]